MRQPIRIPPDYPRPPRSTHTRSTRELEEAARDVDRIASGFAAYLLLWLYGNPDSGWDRRGRRSW